MPSRACTFPSAASKSRKYAVRYRSDQIAFVSWVAKTLPNMLESITVTAPAKDLAREVVLEECRQVAMLEVTREFWVRAKERRAHLPTQRVPNIITNISIDVQKPSRCRRQHEDIMGRLSILCDVSQVHQLHRP